MLMLKGWAPHILFISLLIIAADRILVTNLSDLYLDAMYDGDITALDKALSWDGDNGEALYLKARQLKDNKLSILQRALFHNPADMRPLSMYAQALAEGQSNSQLADYFMNMTSDRMPADRLVRLQSAAYWIDKENLGKAVEEWRYALSIDVSLKDQLFPIFLKISESDQVLVALKQLTESPPDWWVDFVKYVASNSSSARALIDLVHMRHNSSVSLTPDEREAVVGGLMKYRSWDMAYLLWVDGLTIKEKQYLSGLYDGGFETGNSNNGFGWHLMPVKGITSRIKYTSNGDGEGLKSLYIHFRGTETRFKHVYQYTLLPPGAYHFSAKERTGLLEGRGRLRWTIYCANNTDKIIGNSELLLMSKEWREIDFSFEVPEDGCRAQLVRLETVGKHPFDHKLMGSIWFDRLAIRGKH